MADYIEWEALLSMVRPDDPSDEKAAITIATAKELIKSLVYHVPAADVAQVRHGRLLKSRELLGRNEVDCVACTACGESWILSEDDDVVDIGWNYCPNCGCRMDGQGGQH